MIEEVIDVLLNNGIDVIDVHNLCISLKYNCKKMYISYVIDDIKQCHKQKQDLGKSKEEIVQKIKQLWFDWQFPTQPPDDFFDETYQRDCIIEDIFYIENRMSTLYKILQIERKTT